MTRPRRLREDAALACQIPIPELHAADAVEVFFGIIARQAIRRGSFDSVTQLVAAIGAFIDAYNDRCKPLRLDQTGDEILARATRQPTSDAGQLGSTPRRPRATAGADVSSSSRRCTLAACVSALGLWA